MGRLPEYARSQPLSPRAGQLVDDLLALPHIGLADRIACERLAALLDSLDRVEARLANGRVENRQGQARGLLDVQVRLSREVREHLDRLGLTPAARASWVRGLTEGSFRDQVERRMREAITNGG